MATLIIVDMQPYFGGSQEPWLIKNVCREIREAKKRKDGIVVLQFDGCGRTDKRIIKTIGLYSHKAIKWKYDCDGSSIVISTMRKLKLEMGSLRVVGVYTNACVKDTVLGLSNALPKSEIVLVADACNHETRTNRNHGRSGIRRKNIKFDKMSVKLPKNIYNLR